MNHLNTIKRKIEELYDLNLSENTRKREYVEARGFFVKIARDKLSVTYKQIANVINKDHATAIHSKKVIEDLLTYDVELKRIYQEILNSLNLEDENFNHLTSDELKKLAKSLIRENKLLKLQLQK